MPICSAKDAGLHLSMWTLLMVTNVKTKSASQIRTRKKRLTAEGFVYATKLLAMSARRLASQKTSQLVILRNKGKNMPRRAKEHLSK